MYLYNDPAWIISEVQSSGETETERGREQKDVMKANSEYSARCNRLKVDIVV
jgi:hypothetical protein